MKQADIPTSPQQLYAQAAQDVRQGRYSQAEALLRQLAEQAPSARIWNELGNLHTATGRLRAAHICYEQALCLDPHDARIISNLAGVLSMLGETDEAFALLRLAVDLAPDGAEVRSNYLMHLHYAAQLDPAALLSEHRQVARGYPDARFRLSGPSSPVTQASSPRVSMASCPRSSEMTRKERGLEDHETRGQDARVTFQTKTDTPSTRQSVRDRNADRPLRVGFIGPDFRRHSVAFFFESLLDATDPQSERIHLYADVPQPDEVSHRLARKAAAWRDIADLNDDQAAAAIRNDAIDVLIDLAGHTRGTRLGVLTHRPARLQGTWLGYPDTTGLDCVDVRLTDALADPPDNDAFHTETLLRLDGCFLCYRPPEDTPPIEPALPSDAADCVTFGAFCSQRKINDNLLALWSAVLQAVPDSRLLLKLRSRDDDGIGTIFRQRLHAVGVDPARVSIALSSSYADHLAMHRFVDVMLDTYPYNGTTSTCEALYMGVPVVSLVGKHHASRVGLSLLTAAGLDVLAAADPQTYVTLAASLARNTQARSLLRQNLRRQMHANGLCDAPRFAAAFRSALRHAWQIHLATTAG